MSKNRRRDGERPCSQRALVRSIMGEVRGAFPQVERNADGGTATLISKITDGAPRRSGDANSGHKLQREFIGDKAHRAAQMERTQRTLGSEVTVFVMQNSAQECANECCACRNG
jgi:hypothetical protein